MLRKTKKKSFITFEKGYHCCASFNGLSLTALPVLQLSGHWQHHITFPNPYRNNMVGDDKIVINSVLLFRDTIIQLVVDRYFNNIVIKTITTSAAVLLEKIFEGRILFTFNQQIRSYEPVRPYKYNDVNNFRITWPDEWLVYVLYNALVKNT